MYAIKKQMARLRSSAIFSAFIISLYSGIAYPDVNDIKSVLTDDTRIISVKQALNKLGYYDGKVDAMEKAGAVPDKSQAQLEAEQSARISQELQRVRRDCTSNSVKGKMYDCGCIANAFEQARESDPVSDESTLINALYRMKDPSCADRDSISEENVSRCLVEVKYDIEMSTKSAAAQSAYCQCVGDTTAENFMKNPQLKSYIIKDAKVAAALSCLP